LDELRYLLIPEHTDSTAELQKLAAFIAELDPQIPLRLNAFQHHGVKGTAQKWPVMKKEDVERIADNLHKAGLRNIIRPAVYL